VLELAWHIFRGGHTDIEEHELDGFTQAHLERFRLTRDPKQLKQDILDSRLLQNQYGKYRFSYRYPLYYFVARYMRDNEEDPEVNTCVVQAVDGIHREDLANILIFYTYLTRNKKVVARVLDAARELFKETEACNLARHVEFITRLQEKVPNVVLPDADPREGRRALLRHADAEESRPVPAEPDEAAYPDATEFTISMNRAAKVLQVLGQILRNFSGSWRRELKREITRECFDLGLRTLNSVYSYLERHLDRALGELADLFGRNFSDLPEKRRVEAAKELVFFVTELLCFGTLRRISYTVGSEVLVPTYDDVEAAYDNRATRFVQLCLRLDHCRQFPEKRVLELKAEVDKDTFGLTLLRMLVAEHFHQFPRPFRVRQSVCARLGISYRPALEKPKAALPPGKTPGHAPRHRS